MSKHSTFEKAYQLALKEQVSFIEINGIFIELHFNSESYSWLLKSVVFSDQNYIPLSVRDAVNQAEASSEFYLTVNNHSLSIELQKSVICFDVKEVEEEFYYFIDVSLSWRERLWERGQRDLLPVKVL
jgi:hypothetical protein